MDGTKTIAEVADAEGVDPKTVLRWIRTGLRGGIRLKAAKRGHEWRVKAADVVDFYRRLTESVLEAAR